ncbi:MAG: hypothetical protein LBJ71_02515 [Holosporaceae bacterium]|nr:hypothetical protein [Holosporaceae bacterium]
MFCILQFFYAELNALNCDVVYVINLNSDAELCKIENQLKKFNIKFREFKIIDGQSTKIANNANNRLNLKCKPTFCRGMHPEDFSRALKYLKVVEDIVQNNYRSAIVFEKNIKIQRNKIIKNNCDEKGDVLFLNTESYRDKSSHCSVTPEEITKYFKLPKTANRRITRFSSKNGEEASGFHAYAVTFDEVTQTLRKSGIIQYPVGNHFMVVNNTSHGLSRKKVIYGAEDTES